MGITSPFATNVPLAVPIYPAYTSTFHLQGTGFFVELVSNTGFAIPTSYVKTWLQWLDYPNFAAFESPSFMIETFCIVAVVHEPRPVHCIPDFFSYFSTYLLNRQNSSCQIRMQRPLLTFPHIEIFSPPTGPPPPRQVPPEMPFMEAISGGNQADTMARATLLGASL